ncbi:hypothetical protein FKM82_020849 [Ascaphus truei]
MCIDVSVTPLRIYRGSLLSLYTHFNLVSFFFSFPPLFLSLPVSVLLSLYPPPSLSSLSAPSLSLPSSPFLSLLHSVFLSSFPLSSLLPPPSSTLHLSLSLCSPLTLSPFALFTHCPISISLPLSSTLCASPPSLPLSLTRHPSISFPSPPALSFYLSPTLSVCPSLSLSPILSLSTLSLSLCPLPPSLCCLVAISWPSPCVEVPEKIPELQRLVKETRGDPCCGNLTYNTCVYCVCIINDVKTKNTSLSPGDPKNKCVYI